MSITNLGPEGLELSISEESIEDFIRFADSPDIIGQPRAIRALNMGIEIHGRGYNIMVSGLSGTGRKSAIKKILKEYQKDNTTKLSDIVYVYNFCRPDKPRVLHLAAGDGLVFKQRIHDLVEELKALIRNQIDSKNYKQRKNELFSLIEEEENRRFSDLETELSSDGFQLVKIREEEKETTDIRPLFEGEALDFEELHSKLSEEQWQEMRQRYYQHMDRMKSLFEELQEAREHLDQELESLKKELIEPDIRESIDRVKELYSDKGITEYLEQFSKDVSEHLYLFMKNSGKEEENTFPALIRYGVNVLVDNTDQQGAPVVFENHPSHTNLFGTIESKFDLAGNGGSSFMMIKPGSLITASGGFLILEAADLLKEEGLWDNLKRCLQAGSVEIQNQESAISLQNQVLKPEPIRIATKIILTGGENLYDFLYNQDPEFSKHFKISAEFDSVMERTPENCGRYIGFARMICKDEELLYIEHSGMAELIRFGIFEAEQKDRLSTRFSMIADLIRESDYWAKKDKKESIDRDSVQRALEERRFLWNLPEEKLTEMIMSGEMLLDIQGRSVGRVNGLAIHDRGYYAFGMPTVISATASPGSEGIINIEREVGLSGEIHDKWLMIIEGFLRREYALNFPLSIYASICFEQSYGEVDGDSASSAEVYALLSAIGDFDLRMDIAVTGSVNQLGQLQPVGGISEKIMGYYSICSQKGLNGSQGVIVPSLNRNNLMLPKEICQAVQEKRFHIWSADTIDDGLQLLSGLAPGEANKKGIYPSDSFRGKIQSRLKEMANQVKDYSG